MENIEPSIAVNQSWNEAFSDLSGVVKNEMVSGDPQILEILWPGAHRAAAIPERTLIPPTGKPIQVPAATWIRVRDGKYSEIRHYFDLIGMLSQLGLAPS